MVPIRAKLGKKNLILNNASYTLRQNIARLCNGDAIIKKVRLLSIETFWNEQMVYSTAG